MDSDANLREQLDLASLVMKRADEEVLHRSDSPEAVRLAELVLAMDRWRRDGGALPIVWDRAGRV